MVAWLSILVAIPIHAQNPNPPAAEITGDYVIKPNDCFQADFKGEKNTHLLMDRKTGKGLVLDVTGLDMSKIRPGSRVSVKGAMKARQAAKGGRPFQREELQASSIEAVAAAEAPASGSAIEGAPSGSMQAAAPPEMAGAAAVTDLKCLLLFANTSDYTVDATKKATSEAYLFGSGGNVSDAIEDATYGYYRLVAGDSVVLDLPTTTASTMNADDMRTLMQSKAQALGYNCVTGTSNTYQRVFFFMPNGVTEGGTANWTAWAYIDSVGGPWCHSVYSYKWSGAFFDGHAHESCHNFGMQHSSEGSSEYGDETCIMGLSHSGSGKSAIATLNPVKKDQLGVFNGYSGSKISPTTDKTLSLYPLATSPASQAGARCIKFAYNGTNYYISYGRHLSPYGYIWNADSAKRDKVLVYTNTGYGAFSYLSNNLAEGGSLSVGSTTIKFERYGNIALDYATVSFDVADGNSKPVANTQSPSTLKNNPVAITLTGSDADAGDVLTYSVVSGPTNGSLTGTAPNLTYSPYTDYVGSDSFVFNIDDGKISSFATVNITVNDSGGTPSGTFVISDFGTTAPSTNIFESNDPSAESWTAITTSGKGQNFTVNQIGAALDGETYGLTAITIKTFSFPTEPASAPTMRLQIYKWNQPSLTSSYSVQPADMLFDSTAPFPVGGTFAAGDFVKFDFGTTLNLIEGGNYAFFLSFSTAGAEFRPVITTTLAHEGVLLNGAVGTVKTNQQMEFFLTGSPTPPPNNYSSWISGFTGLGSLTGFGDDADGDGQMNGIEDYFGTHPGEFSRGVVAGVMSGNTMTFSHPLNGSPANDIIAAYRWSKDLLGFHADGQAYEGTTVSFSQGEPSPEGIVTVTATISGAPVDRLFLDIQVTQH